MRARVDHGVRTIGAVVYGLTLLLARPAVAADVLVFAAASLADVLTEIGTRGPADADPLLFNFGASSDLARQIRAGAPADVFFSADLAQMEGLEQAGLVRRADRLDVLSNVLAAIVPAGSTLDVRAPRDLVRARRLAVANPEGVPAGIYAKRYLEAQGMWADLAPQIVPTLDVRAALAAVAAGHADAGIVYRTDAAISDRVRVAFEVPRAEGPDVVYPLAPVAASKRPDAAAAAVRRLVAPEALAVYARHGFVVLVGR